MDLIQEHPDLIAAIQGLDSAPVAVVLDTLNRSLTGSENSDQDMGAYIKATDAIRETFNCSMLVVHHCGNNDSRHLAVFDHATVLISGSIDEQLIQHAAPRAECYRRVLRARSS
jgi:RecA-family ATPase